MVSCLIGLGANLGGRRRALLRAIERLAGRPEIRLVAQSDAFETQPVGGPSGQRAFLNAAVRVETTLSAVELADALVEIETAQGRTRGERWGPRTIDLDLLLYGDSVIDTPRLIVPHPRMAFRRFVLEPAAQVAAEMVHPHIGWTIGRLLKHLNDAANYVALAGPMPFDKARLAREAASRVGGRALDSPPCAIGASNAVGDSADRLGELLSALRVRRELLSGAHWPDKKRIVVSDFWIGDLLSEARLILAPHDLATFEQSYQVATAEVIVPKLLVAAHEYARGSASGGRQFPEGPVLWLRTGDYAQALTEVAAACEAMQ